MISKSPIWFFDFFPPLLIFDVVGRFKKQIILIEQSMASSLGKSANIFWQEWSVGKADRQKLLKQKGCVVWITGLSGSGLSLDHPTFFFLYVARYRVQ